MAFLRRLEEREGCDLSEIFPDASEQALDLLAKLLVFNPAQVGVGVELGLELGVGVVLELGVELALDLLAKLLVFNPAQRLSVADALQHPWFAALHT